MADERDALIEHYAQMREDLLSGIAGLSDEQLTEPSLDRWSVKDHLAHLALWDDMRIGEVIRISAGYRPAWRMTDEQKEQYNSLARDLQAELPVEQVRWELSSTRQRLVDALREATPEGLDALRYGEAALWSRHEALHTGWIRRWRDERGI